MNTSHHLTVKFEGDGIPHSERGSFLMALEKWARAHTGKPVEVFLDRLKDDSEPAVAELANAVLRIFVAQNSNHPPLIEVL